MEDKEKMTAERSLEIIRESIERSRRDITRNAGLPMIMWGSLVSVTAIAVWYLWQHTGNPSWNMLWFIMTAVGWGITAITSRKDSKKPSTFISKVLGWTWLSFGIFAMATAVIGALPNSGTVYGSGLPITAMIILLLGMGAMTTGLILRNKTITIFSTGAIVTAGTSLANPGPYEPLAMGMTALMLLIIPGIIINRKSKRL